MKKGRTRLLSALLSAVLVLGLLPATALAAPSIWYMVYGAVNDSDATSYTYIGSEDVITADYDLYVIKEFTIDMQGKTVDMNSKNILVNSGGKLTFKNCTIVGENYSSVFQVMGTGELYLENCVIKDNTKPVVNLLSGKLSIEHCKIRDNVTSFGAIEIKGGEVVMEDSTITNNIGGGIFYQLGDGNPESKFTFIGNCLIWDNVRSASDSTQQNLYNGSYTARMDYDVSGAGSGTKIGLSSAKVPPVSLTVPNSTDCSAFFVSDRPEYPAYYDTDTGELGLRSNQCNVFFFITGSAPTLKKATIGFPFTLPSAPAAPSGMSFDGWTVSGGLYQPGDVYHFTADTTVYASFSTLTPSSSDDSYVRPEPIIGGLKPSTPEQPVSPIEPDPAAPVFADVPSDAWYAAAVDYCVSKGIMAGTGEGQFAPEAETSRGMVVQMLYSLAGKPAAGTSSFSDVSSDAWYADAVAWANSLGIVSGVGENAFAPEQAISREQLALILYKFAQLQGRDVTVDGDTNFMDYTDVRDIHDYAKTAFFWCIQEGLISGTGNDTLSPLTTATRAQLAQIMMNYDKK